MTTHETPAPPVYPAREQRRESKTPSSAPGTGFVRGIGYGLLFWALVALIVVLMRG